MIDAQTLTGKIEANELTGSLDKYIEVIEPVLQEKESTPTKQTQVIQYDEEYNGLSQVTVNPIPDEYIIPALDSKTITNNGEYFASDDNLNGYSSVKVNVPTGGGMTINGTLVSKEIQSGTISKGDFVKRGIYNIEDRVSSSSQMGFSNNPTITNESNLYDNNDNTYASIKASGTNALALTADCKSKEQLNIPQNALIKSVSCVTKFQFRSANGTVNTFIKMQTTGTFFAEGQATSPSTTLTTLTKDFGTFGETWNTNSYRVRFYCSTTSSSIDIYYIKFDITYEYDGQIRKVTSDADTTIGIANENGSQGDTIEVYVPNEQ